MNRRPGEATPAGAETFVCSFAELMQHTAPLRRPGMATPALAAAWADAILCYWEHGIACGAIDAAEPLYIADLAPAGGLLAWRLLQALQSRLAASRRALNPCLVACCASPGEADALLGHPAVEGLVQSGWLDASLFDADSDSALTLRHQKLGLLATCNPVVLLALDHFAGLPSELMAVHYGELLHSTVAARPAGEALDLSYQWPPSTAGTDSAPLRHVLDYYLSRFHSTALLLPRRALRTLERMQRLAGGRYLLLAADAGVCDEQAIRLGAMTPPCQWQHSGNAVPVNYHALALAQGHEGATVWNRQLMDDGVVLHAAWRGDGAGPGMPQLCRTLEAAHPGHEAALRRMMRGAAADPAAMLALLRQSQHDPAMLDVALDVLAGTPPALRDCARREWHSALSAAWANHLPPVTDNGFACRLAQLALQLGFYELATDCLHSALRCYGENAFELYLLAWCEARTGRSSEALTHTARALALKPDYEAAQRLQSALADKLARWRQLPIFVPALAARGLLHIEPLGPEHAAGLHFQLRDEQISVMTRLPAIENLEQAQAWIAAETSDPGRHAYAVVHEHWGFTGIVAAQCAPQAAYFYFWTGSDYQGRGCGQAAALLLFTQLRHAGISDIYTSVERVNQGSRHVLQKLGFAQLDIKTAAPDDTQDFYYAGEKDNPAAIIAGLLDLCEEIGSPVNII